VGLTRTPQSRYRNALVRSEPLREGKRAIADTVAALASIGHGLQRVSFCAAQREFGSLTLFAVSTGLMRYAAMTMMIHLYIEEDY